MKRSFFVVILIAITFAANAFAGDFGSFYRNPQSYGSIAAPVHIKDKGIYNLVVSVHFLTEPYNAKVYRSDEYKRLINRLSVEWCGVALQQIMEAKELNIRDLNTLKGNIEKDIIRLAEKLKDVYAVEKNTEVVFSFSQFILLSPKDND